MLTVSEAAALLRSFDRVLILTHIRPDGDTVGCAAGLCAALRAIGKTAYLLPNPGLTENTAPYFTPYSAPADFVPEKVVSTDIATVGLFPDNAKSYADKVDLAIDHHLKNGDIAGLPLYLLALSGQIIELLAVDLDGGIHGRDLRDRAGEAGEDGFQRRPVHSDGMGLQRFPGRILGVGDQPQPQTGNILLFAVFREFYGTGSLSHKHRQNAGGHRV